MNLVECKNCEYDQIINRYITSMTSVTADIISKTASAMFPEIPISMHGNLDLKVSPTAHTHKATHNTNTQHITHINHRTTQNAQTTTHCTQNNT